MDFILMVFFSTIPLLTAGLLLLIERSKISYTLALFFTAISVWQLDVSFMFGSAWLEESTIQLLFSIFRIGSASFTVLLFYLAYQIINEYDLSLSKRQYDFFHKWITKKMLLLIIIWTGIVYGIGFTEYGIHSLEWVEFEIIGDYLYPVSGSLDWTFSLNVLFILVMNLVNLWLASKVLNKHKRTFLLTFLISLLFAYLFGVINLLSSSPLFQTVLALIILTIGIFTAFVHMNANMIKEMNDHLKTRQEFQRKLIDLNPNLIYVKDNNGRFIMANDAVAHFYNTVPEHMLGKTEFDVQPRGRFAENMLKQDYQLLADNKSRISSREVMFSTSGDERVFQISKVPVEYSNQQAGLLCVATDITEIEEHQEYIKRAEKLSVVGELAAGVAHEIRNPLTSLKGFLQLLNEQHDIESYYIEIMVDELDRIDFVASELLILAKPEITQKKDISVNYLISNVIELLRANNDQCPIEVDPEIDGQITEIFGNYNQLKQVLINIIKNACDASELNESVKVTAFEEEMFIVIRVKDDGVGMSQDRINKLGEPFYTSKEKGTGLGLMVSFKIIDDHNGSISYESILNQGTTATIRFPKQLNIS